MLLVAATQVAFAGKGTVLTVIASIELLFTQPLASMFAFAAIVHTGTVT